MSYIEQSLMPGESVIYEAKVHWFVYVSSFILLGIGFWFLWRVDLSFTDSGAKGLGYLAYFSFFCAACLFIKAVIKRTTTEIAVTSKRVISKTGLLSTKTTELNHSKVESFSVDRGFFGLIFGFGNIVVTGTGGVRNVIECIDNPLLFRKYAMKIIDQIQQA